MYLVRFTIDLGVYGISGICGPGFSGVQEFFKKRLKMPVFVGMNNIVVNMAVPVYKICLYKDVFPV